MGVATASHDELVGKRLGQTSIAHPSSLDYVPIMDLDQAEEFEAPVVLSGLQTDEARHRELDIAEGRWVFTNASANRMEDYVALFNAYVGGDQMAELNNMSIPGRVVAGGNCVAIPLSMVAKPLNEGVGITSLSVGTLQGWSGRGDTEVPAGYEREFPPIPGDEQQKIEEEPNKFLGLSITEHAGIDIEATPKRGTWLLGHHIKFKMGMARPTTMEEVVELLEEVRMPQELEDFQYGKKGPQERPLRMSKNRLLVPDKKHLLKFGRQPKPMRADVHIKKVSKDGLTVKGEIAANNLLLGASASNIMNVMLARALGYI